MEFITHLVQSVLSGAVPLIVLLGLLIFVHEMGHFLVAKYYKVRVETFSLGFGPKLFKFTRGETVYAISAIPLGGYVKMYGDDPTAEIPAEEKQHSFSHKPVGQRIAVVLAGPLMNFFFAILIFTVISFLGENTLSPVLGDIGAKTAASALGFRSGDVVTQVNSNPVKSWDEVQKLVEHSAGELVRFDVKHTDGKVASLEATPKLIPNPSVMSWDRMVGEIEGLSVESRASVVGVLDPKSSAALAGLKTGDVITKIGDDKITMWREVLASLATHASDAQLAITFDRSYLGAASDTPPASQTVTVAQVQTPTKTSPKAAISAAAASGTVGSSSADGASAGVTAGASIAKAIGIEFPELYLAEMEKNAPAAKAGLAKGDRLVSIDGEKVGSFDQVASIIRSFGTRHPEATKGGASSLAIIVSRDGAEKTFAISPNMKKRMNMQGQEEQRFEIGIRPFIIDAAPATFKAVAANPVQAVTRGVQLSMKWTSLTVLSFVRLFQGEVSSKSIGGFLSIGQMAKKSWQIGLTQFLSTMALISINLFVLNLLPVPVLDGGHLVFSAIEVIKGAPLSMRKMEIAQQVGMALLLCLMVFALFNDFSRFLGNG